MVTGYITLGQKSAIKKVVISTFVIIRKTFRWTKIGDEEVYALYKKGRVQ